MTVFYLLAFLIVSGGIDKTLGSAIDVQVDEKKAYNHIIDSLDLLCYVFLISLTIVTLWAFKNKRIRFLHESGLAVIYGLIVGLMLKYSGPQRTLTHLRVKPFSNEMTYTPSEVNASHGNALPDSLLISFQLPADTDPTGDTNMGSSEKEQEEHERPSKHLYSYLFQGEYVANEEETTIEETATFNPEIFFYILLPPIIFHAGYSMRKKSFFDNLGAILAFALFGTVISTVVIAIIVYGFAQFISSSVSFKFLDMLYFGAIVSATDPVTVLAIFNDLHADTMLNGLILGESLLNDAVAIVLCSAIEEYSKLSLTKGDVFETNALLLTVLKFFTILLGSVGLGSLVGSLTAMLTKFTHVKDFPLLETTLFFLLSYSSYLIAEICSMSGIVSVLFCGIFQAHYTFRNLSCESQQRTKQLFETLNFLMENFIFCYLGVSLFTYSHHQFNFVFIFGAIVAIALARALHIYPLSLLLNLGRKQKIPMKYQHMLWFSGLRGAMAFALALRNTVSDVRQMFFTTTCIITIATVIFCGGMTVPVLTMLEIPVGVRDDEREELLRANGDVDSLQHASLASNMSSGSCSRRSWLARAWRGVDSKLMKPLLTSSRPSLMETMPSCCAPLARILTTTDQMGGAVQLTDVTASDNNADPSQQEQEQDFSMREMSERNTGNE